MNYLSYLLVIAVSAVVSSDNIGGASFITKCKINDSSCLKKSANAALPVMAVGIPELGIEPVDPHYIRETDISSQILKLVLSNVTMAGFKDTVIQKIKFDNNNSKLTIKWLCNIQIEGMYEMDGNLIVLRLTGKGPLHCTVRNIEVTTHADVKEIIGKDGAAHWQLTYKDHSYVLKSKSDVTFENLFDGNDFLASTAKAVIANSGNDIIYEVGSPVIKDFVLAVIDNINKLFEHFSIKELSIE